jgi:hypothetical protein
MTSDIGAIEQQATEAVSDNRQALAEELESIQRMQDYSDAAKERYANEATAKASERHATIVEKHETATAATLENNEKRVFKLSYPAANITETQKEAFRSSYRDASFRCVDLQADALERLMTRAQRTEDRAMEQAIYHESIERGVFGVANQYREKHPEAKAAWETYAQARRVSESNEALLGRALLSKVAPGPEAG